MCLQEENSASTYRFWRTKGSLLPIEDVWHKLHIRNLCSCSLISLSSHHTSKISLKFQEVHIFYLFVKLSIKHSSFWFSNLLKVITRIRLNGNLGYQRNHNVRAKSKKKSAKRKILRSLKSLKSNSKDFLRTELRLTFIVPFGFGVLSSGSFSNGALPWLHTISFLSLKTRGSKNKKN